MGGKVEGHKGPGIMSFHGRAGQGEWVWGFVTSTVGAAFVGLVPFVGPILSLTWTIRMIAYSTRRLHDLKQSGWLQLIPMALTVLSFGLFAAFTYFGLADFSRFSTDGGTVPDISRLENFQGGLTLMEAIPIGLSWISVGAWVFLYGAMLVTPGTNGPNPYGEADRN
jgi:uncharacterized membrane protein YhaH (DUF805 family)